MVTTTCAGCPPWAGSCPVRSANWQTSTRASARRAAGVRRSGPDRVADRPGERLDRGVDDRRAFHIQHTGQADAAEPVGGQGEPAALLRVLLFAVEPVAELLVGQVGVDVGQDAVAEAAQDGGFELGGVADQHGFDLVDQAGFVVGDVGQHPADRHGLGRVDCAVGDGVG